ncbi:MAG: LPS-assembly protein LptD, partial [Calditrichaeota bacterium]
MNRKRNGLKLRFACVAKELLPLVLACGSQIQKVFAFASGIFSFLFRTCPGNIRACLLGRKKIAVTLFFLPIAFTHFFVTLSAQEIDSLLSQQQRLVTIPDDSVAVLSSPQTQKSDIDAPIHYEALDFDNDIKNGILYLTDNAVVKYQEMEIRAGKIQVNQQERVLIAEALPETIYVALDSTLADVEKDSFTVKFSQYPVLKDGQQEITGERMVYNFDSQKGIIEKGRAELDGGYFTGTQIKRVDKKVLNVTSGTYTTCKEEHPHFHFWARRMKMIMSERIIAKPIVLYISKIPIAYLPFAMFPTKSGRKSGVLIPRYGESSTEGKFLKGLGYYWAINDYLDAKTTADYYDQSGWLFRGGLNYNKRYSYSGRISGSWTRKNFTTGRVERRW